MIVKLELKMYTKKKQTRRLLLGCAFLSFSYQSQNKNYTKRKKKIGTWLLLGRVSYFLFFLDYKIRVKIIRKGKNKHGGQHEDMRFFQTSKVEQKVRQTKRIVKVVVIRVSVFRFFFSEKEQARCLAVQSIEGILFFVIILYANYKKKMNKKGQTKNDK